MITVDYSRAKTGQINNFPSYVLYDHGRNSCFTILMARANLMYRKCMTKI